MDKDISVQNGCQGIKSVREYVALYHAKGWNVIALEPYEKKPAWSTWKEEQEKKQDDSILELKYWDSVNVGVICGKISNNLFVVDCDTEKSALWFIQNFKEYLGTYQVKTKRGIHYYFQVKGEIDKIESFKIKMEDEDIQIDVQGDGKYVVAPPSVVNYIEDNENIHSHEYHPVGELSDVIVLDVDEYKNFINKLKSLLQQRVLKQMMGGNEDKEQENIYEIDLEKLREVVIENYKEGVRHYLVLYTTGFLRKNGVSEEDCTKFWESVWEQVHDEEQKSRYADIRTTYTNDMGKVAGYSKLVEFIQEEAIQSCIKSQRTIPEPFANENGVLVTVKKDSIEPLCEFFFVSDVVRNVKDESNVGYILRFPGRNKEIYASLDDLTKNRFTKFFSKHISMIDESTAQKILKYIARYTLSNKQFLKTRYAVESIGWIGDDYYLPQLKPHHYFILGHGTAGFGSKGEKQKEEELFRLLIEEKSYLSLGYAIGVAGILLPLLDIENFVIFANGRTGSGKSTTSFVALSLFGNYERLKASSDNANVGFELFLKNRNHSVAVMDELNTATGDAEKVAENLTRTIYKFAIGVGKMRSMKEIVMREEIRYEGILYVSAEDDFRNFLRLSKKTVKGALRRTVLINFDTLYQEQGEQLQEWTERIYETIKENYGNMLSDIISKIKQDIEQIRKDYKDFLSYFKNEDQGWRFGGQERYFALLNTATKFLERHTQMDMKFLFELIDKIAEHNNAIFNQSVRITRDDLLNEIENWMAENYSFFKITQTTMVDKDMIVETTQKQPQKSLYGKVENDKVLITSIGLSSLAKHLQTSEMELKRLLAEYRLAEKDDERGIKRTTRTIDGISLKVYEIKMG